MIDNLKELFIIIWSLSSRQKHSRLEAEVSSSLDTNQMFFLQFQANFFFFHSINYQESSRFTSSLKEISAQIVREFLFLYKFKWKNKINQF